MLTRWDYKKFNDDERSKIISNIKRLYICENKTDDQISIELQIKSSLIKSLRNENNIHRSKEATNLIKEQNNLAKYGVTNPSKLNESRQKQSDSLKNVYKQHKTEILNKRKATNIERYGFENAMQNNDIKQRCFDGGGGWNQDVIKNTKLAKYSDPYYNNHNKVKDELKEKFNVINVSQISEVKEKIKQTWKNKSKEDISRFVKKLQATKLEKYGNANYVNGNAISISLKSKSLLEKQEIVNKRKLTMLSKYGVSHAKQRHLTNEEIEIISSKDNLEQFIIKNNIKHFFQLENLLPNLSQSYIGKKIHEYNLDNYIEYLTSSSKYEIEIANVLEDYHISYIRNDRNVINPLELDFYIPEYDLAIEFNGTYWHSAYYKDKTYHYNKSKLCEDKGIRLIHIWEHEWENDKQKSILINMILTACQKSKTIYARKCKIVIKDSNDMKEFFETNNIQGFRPGKMSICLEYDNEIVMAYQMGFNFFGKGKYEWEVIRGATKLGYNVVGGASKIWKFFKEIYNPQSCVYYVDYNYFTGSSVLKLDSNFRFIKSQPGFKNWYVEENIIKNRDPKNHNKVKELEKEGKVIPIYNSGTKVYVYHSGVENITSKSI